MVGLPTGYHFPRVYLQSPLATVVGIDTIQVERRLRARHGETLARVEACAAEVVTTWGGPSTTDPAMIRQGLKRVLSNRGVLPTLLEMLQTAFEGLRYDLPSNLVAAPPYVTVTSVGPVLRGTVEDGRLLVTIGVFEISGEDHRRYTRAPQNRPLTVEWVDTPSTTSE